MRRVIAIDGPSGAGKSTISRLLAERLGFEFLDTGALYRAVGLYLKRRGLDEGDSDEDIREKLKGVSVLFKGGRVFLKEEVMTEINSGSREVNPTIPPLTEGGEGGFMVDLSEAIRTTEAGHYASVFSAKRAVREFLLQVQRDAALSSDIVAEGRDMTTVVFPDAWKKFYLDASEHGRARRRYLQLIDKGAEMTLEDALRDVKERDARDSSRDIAPLKRADDAVYIDTTEMNIEEVLQYMMDVIESGK